jgi:hypothetical protein
MSNLQFKLLTFLILVSLSHAGITLPRLSPESQECIECHREETPALYHQWGSSAHYRANVGCYECHMADRKESDVIKHNGVRIATVVSPKDCARCHEKEVEEFSHSRHAHAALSEKNDLFLANTVMGGMTMKTRGFRDGVSPSMVTGCAKCHGSEVKFKNEELDPATWPNAGIGRINPDGSKGSCTACHSRHSFSVAEARSPESCARCHIGEDHQQMEIFSESKHGALWSAHKDRQNLNNPKWILGEDYHDAPSCVTCHMSANTKLASTHDVGMRVSWNNRGVKSIKSDEADTRDNLPGKDISWKERKKNMVKVCMQCHNEHHTENFYTQYDATIDFYHEKYAIPGETVYAAARELLEPAPMFSHPVDFLWYEIWHKYARALRHGASMMGTSQTYWKGYYEISKVWYSQFIPELKKLAEEKSKTSPEKAQMLQNEINKILNSPHHNWQKPADKTPEAVNPPQE